MTPPSTRAVGPVPGAPAVTAPSRGYGSWRDDARGRPEFVVHPGRLGVPAASPVGQRIPTDPWHLVGSPGLLALAHFSGAVSLYATGGGMVHLADRTAVVTVDGAPIPPTGLTLGVDHATWTHATTGVRIRRTLTADPDLPRLALLVEVDADRPVTVRAPWVIHHVPLVPGGLMARRAPVPSTHRGSARLSWRAGFLVSGASRSATDAFRSWAGRRHPLLAAPGPVPERSVRWVPTATRVRPRGPRPFLWVPPTVELGIDDDPSADPAASTPAVGIAVDRAGATLIVGVDGSGPVTVSSTLRLVDPLLDGPADVTGTGAAPPEPAGGPVATEPPDARPDPSAARNDQLERLDPPHPSDPCDQLDREARWHVAQLRALRVPDPWTGRTFVMQGSAYGFVHGVHGAVRDEAFVVAALAPSEPATARDVLVGLCAMARPDGTFHYAHAGCGAGISAGVHANPTDLGLFQLWAVAEYLDATGDTDVLAERVRPRGRSGWRPSVAEVTARSVDALDARVGTGPHGMLRVGSGDWADPISLMVRRRGAFHRHGESAFNTGMALAVLPRIVPLLDTARARRCGQIVDALDAALEAAWTGRWYLRGWDGRGGAIGRSHCFLDAQLWPLIAGHGPPERRAALVETVATCCDDPSPIGPTILDRPHPVRLGMLADGWDCNGGVWAALGGLTAWAWARHDPDRATALLQRMSFAAQQAAYPDIWFGQWSGPDARNSTMGDAPGGTFVHPATPMTEFPVMNANAHAGPLLGLAKLRSVGAAGSAHHPTTAAAPPRRSTAAGGDEAG